jgi:hypothetical protein
MTAMLLFGMLLATSFKRSDSGYEQGKGQGQKD